MAVSETTTLEPVAPVDAPDRNSACRIEERYAAEVALCYQCKRCTSGCPVAQEMEYRPHQVIRMVRMGMSERLLSSDSVWTCVGCYQCATRCPQSIPITDIMYSLKAEAMLRGTTAPRARPPAFTKAFTSTVERFGRSHEPVLLARYYLSTDPRPAFKFIPLGIKMFLQGRLPISIHRAGRWRATRMVLHKIIRNRQEGANQ